MFGIKTVRHALNRDWERVITKIGVMERSGELTMVMCHHLNKRGKNTRQRKIEVACKSIMGMIYRIQMSKVVLVIQINAAHIAKSHGVLQKKTTTLNMNK